MRLKPFASMASTGDNAGKRYLLHTIEWLKEDIIPTMKPPDCRVYEASDVAKLEQAVQQTKDWLDKNPNAKQNEFYRRERKLMKLSDHIVWDCAKDCPCPACTERPCPACAEFLSATATTSHTVATSHSG